MIHYRPFASPPCALRARRHGDSANPGFSRLFGIPCGFGVVDAAAPSPFQSKPTEIEDKRKRKGEVL